jgi:DMSO/TMAO reductase YedYZ heme-binding membrane subunit
MELKTKLIIAGGIMSGIVYSIFASLISETENIWLATRLFGLLAYISLFIALTLGEIRMLSKIKGNFTLFRFHVPFSIFSIYLVVMHFISAISDKFKWGVGLKFTDFLGFNFSDKWLILLSLGTLAFYLMFIVGMTSATKSIQFLGFKRWKIIHYLSYLSFIIAYIHSINLGTDLRHSVLSPILFPFFVASFLFVISLLITRILNSFSLFSDQLEIILVAAFFILLIFGMAFLANRLYTAENKLEEINADMTASQAIVYSVQEENNQLKQEIKILTDEIEVIKNG